GDSLKSFFKRRLGIAPGQRWIPFDQLDFILGGLVALSFFVRLDWIDIALICAISFVGDVLVNQLSFYLGIRETRW
ncbi:MAG TPA: CDP-archaeol synthase, partial [Polaromonas sp.]|nr:CDP-archaeol synthase [Polaromonas sp.]